MQRFIFEYISDDAIRTLDKGEFRYIEFSLYLSWRAQPIVGFRGSQSRHMTQSRFFQWSLLFPIVIWFGYLVISSVVNSRGMVFIVTNLFGAYPVFVPYFIFAGVIWKLADKKPYKQLVVTALIAPMIWGFFYALSHMLQYYFKERTMEPLSILAIMVFWATLAGYLVEAVPLVLLTIFKDDFKSS